MVDCNASADHPSLCIFDLFLDIPHPNASQQCTPTQIVEPPDLTNNGLISEMYHPDKISRLARFAYPDYDSSQDDSSAHNNPNDTKTGGTRGRGAGLNKDDVYITSFTPHHHTFTIQLQDGLRLYAHVRRYLPPHSSSKARIDVGRRSPRAMVILTRAIGGEQFYASVLKTIEALVNKSYGTQKASHYDDSPARSFLHELFNQHWRLCEQHSIMSTGRGRQNVVSDPSELTRSFLERTSNLFKIEIPGVEFQKHLTDTDNNVVSDKIVDGDYVRFHLPPSLQPGFIPDNLYSHCEDINSPILPLLRCVGAYHTMRILSALLCERRVIFVSKCITKLSKCVHAALAMLNQGLLAWRHILIEVLPPHLMKYLTHRQPYLIGLLEPYAEILEMIPGLVDVISVHLDINDIRTHNMSDPSNVIPDLLRVKRNSNPETPQTFSAVEFLSQDLSDILIADRQMWGKHFDGSPLCLKDQKQPDEEGSDSNVSAKRGFRNKILGKVRNKKSKGNSTQEKDQDALEDIPEDPHSANADAFFGKIMRSYNEHRRDYGHYSSRKVGGNDSNSQLLQNQPDLTVEELLLEDATFDPSLFCPNEQGEEEVRSTLVIFFLLLFGDLGMLLSESKEGTLWLDRKKFLLRRKLMGDTENTPMFVMLARLTRTIMFEKFIRCRIFELEKNASDLKKILPHHIPLFVLGEKHLRKSRLAFNFQNIRRVILTTAKALPQHNSVDTCERIRTKVIRLTSSQPFVGDRTSELYSLADECRECNEALMHAMGVIWTRMLETRGNLWKQPIWALHVLKILLLHGPVTAVTEAMCGLDKIRALRTFTGKQADQNRQVKMNAMDMNVLLMHQDELYMRRRNVVAAKVDVSKKLDNFRWADYLIRKLPLSVPFSHIHLLLRPDESTPCIVLKKRTSMSSATTDELTSCSNENEKENDMSVDPANDLSTKDNPPLYTFESSLQMDENSIVVDSNNSKNHINSSQSTYSVQRNHPKKESSSNVHPHPENENPSSPDSSSEYVTSKISSQNNGIHNNHINDGDNVKKHYNDRIAGKNEQKQRRNDSQDQINVSTKKKPDECSEYVSRRNSLPTSSKSSSSYESDYSEEKYYAESVLRRENDNVHGYDDVSEVSDDDDLLSHVQGK